MRKLDIAAIIVSVALLFLTGIFLCKSLYAGSVGDWYRTAYKFTTFSQAFLTGLWFVAREFQEGE